MRRVDLITDIAFWQLGRGDAARVRALAQYLAPRTALRVVALAGKLSAPVVRGRAQLAGHGFSLVAVAPANLPALLHEDPAQVALVEYVRLTRVLDVLPPGTRAFLDTHDLASERNARFAAAGLTPPGNLSDAEEYAAFARYERVICIQADDRATVSRRIGEARTLLAPHPAPLRPVPVRDHAERVGFVASEYAPNVAGLRWLLDAVWPRLSGSAATLAIYGRVGARLDDIGERRGVQRHGLVRDLDAAYASMDAAVNPVSVGAGLKIKTVEALACGLPLVSTTEGARGLLDAAGDAFLLADDADGFVAHLEQVLGSRTLRERLAAGALRLAARCFTPEACFADLLAAIEAPAT